MKFIDLFAGIGGFRRGMELAGHECVGFCEFDTHAVASYTSMHLITAEQRERLEKLDLKARKKEILKEEYRNGEWYANDIRTVRAADIPRADCWCFGFPCQDISTAGNRLGFRGHRSSLFFAVTKLIADTPEKDRPDYLFIENVENLFNINRGLDFARVLIELDSLGYDAEWQLLNSADFGVPQRRKRVFIIGHLRGRCTRQVFPITKTGGLYNPLGKTREIRDIARCLTAGGLEKWQGDYIATTISMTQKDYKESDISPTLSATGVRRGRGNNQPVPGVMIKENTKKGYAIATPGDSINFEQPNSKTRRGRVGKGITNTLNTSCSQGTYDGKRIRGFMPIECFRLQGWEDGYFYRAAFVNADSQLYKQAGNGVTVPVTQEIAQKL